MDEILVPSFLPSLPPSLLPFLCLALLHSCLLFFFPFLPLQVLSLSLFFRSLQFSVYFPSLVRNRIVISRLLKRHLKAKRRAPTYSRALNPLPSFPYIIPSWIF